MKKTYTIHEIYEQEGVYGCLSTDGSIYGKIVITKYEPDDISLGLLLYGEGGHFCPVSKSIWEDDTFVKLDEFAVLEVKPSGPDVS